MNPNDVVDSLQRQLKGLFESGTRYQVEKIGVVVGFLVLVIASVGWAMSGPDDSNELGASFGDEVLTSQLDRRQYYIENEGSKDWTRVRVVFDRKYLYTADKVEGGERLTLGAADLRYFYRMPRPWGRQDWEQLAEGEPPAVSPPESYSPKLVQIRTEQGRIDLDLTQKPAS
ncbi:hypothetical protein DL240_11655 [Lujinxingia litoralis]|uniref:Uncharacterized protein n=1 Tax=Lujinxingia litoralis TaxID=2211119 RepID=A0A328C5C9_9DELT|nr:hypothetical protein [Lujinxingia litoralis]RAL21511.1 hypothetical protein DL240_11655 [Lujinxingia litoralis]